MPVIMPRKTPTGAETPSAIAFPAPITTNIASAQASSRMSTVESAVSRRARTPPSSAQVAAVVTYHGVEMATGVTPRIKSRMIPPPRPSTTPATRTPTIGAPRRFVTAPPNVAPTPTANRSIHNGMPVIVFIAVDLPSPE